MRYQIFTHMGCITCFTYGLVCLSFWLDTKCEAPFSTFLRIIPWISRWTPLSDDESSPAVKSITTLCLLISCDNIWQKNSGSPRTQLDHQTTNLSWYTPQKGILNIFLPNHLLKVGPAFPEPTRETRSANFPNTNRGTTIGTLLLSDNNLHHISARHQPRWSHVA